MGWEFVEANRMELDNSLRFLSQPHEEGKHNAVGKQANEARLIRMKDHLVSYTTSIHSIHVKHTTKLIIV
jgi:hypothetical protein